MNIRKVFLGFTCLLAAAGLVMGIGTQWRFIAVAVVILTSILWVIKPVRQLNWLASGSFSLYLCSAAAGLIMGGQTIWLVIGSIAALAGWDLVLFERGLDGAENNSGSHRCQSEHLKYLAIAIGLGAVMVLPFLLIRIQLPFVIMLAALIGALAGLLLALRYVNKKNTP